MAIRDSFRAEVGTALAERTALLAAIASTGHTFGRGLMPRNTAGQALATGLTGSVNYGLMVTSQSALWAGASLLAPRLLPESGMQDETLLGAYRNRVRLMAYGTYATTYAVSRPLQRLVAQEPGESVARGVVRSTLWRLESAASVGMITTAVSDVALTALSAAGLTGRMRRRAGHGIVLVVGAGMATALVHRQRTREAEATGEAPPALSPRSVAIGVGTAAGLTLLGFGESASARALGGLLPSVIPPSARTAVGHAVMLGALGAGAWQGMQAIYGKTERAGSALEALQATAPDNAHISGGPASSVAWEDLTREGRRFAGTPLSSAEITDVMGGVAMEPVRVFVPLRETEDAQERAEIALAEMDALGAFDRSLIVLCSPTGTGYINYVMAEAVEYLTRGDCAIVTTQYSLRPSFLSLDRVDVGRHNARALVNAVHERVAAMPEESRPRLVQFGESLGAHTGQDVMMHRGAAAFSELGIERALFIGTPDESKWAKEWRADPAGTDPGGIVVEIDSFEEFQALSAERQAASRIFLLSHHEDPIPKFGPELAIRRPDWLDEDRSKRPPGIPPEMQWYPLSTFFVTVADVINAMDTVPGTFGADGHDYRADLARFVSVAYGLPCDAEQMTRVEHALRRRELLIAESRLVADQISAARARAEATMAEWGADPSAADALIGAEVARGERSAPNGAPAGGHSAKE